MNRDSNRVIVCGGRDFDDRQQIIKAMSGLPVGTIIVHGDCQGADRTAAAIAESWGLKTEAHPRGNRTDEEVNQEMVDLGARYVLAFPGGSGTADCIARAEKAGIQVRKAGKKIVRPEDPATDPLYNFDDRDR